MNLFGVSIHGHWFHVNGYQIERPRWSEAWNWSPGWGHTLASPRSWNCPENPEAFRSTPSWSPSQSDEETWLPWDLILLGNTGDLCWRWQQHHCSLAYGRHQCGRHGVRWQSRPNRRCSERPRSDLPVYCWKLLEGLSLGEVRDVMLTLSGAISWVGKEAQTLCQASKPGWWPLADHPSHHWRTCWTKRAQSSSFNPTCFNTIQFL